jgi:hypothetical protein
VSEAGSENQSVARRRLPRDAPLGLDSEHDRARWVFAQAEVASSEASANAATKVFMGCPFPYANNDVRFATSSGFGGLLPDRDHTFQRKSPGGTSVLGPERK